MTHPPSLNRTIRVGKQIRRELADIIRREISDYDFGMLTISRTDVSPDLKYARIYVTVFDDDEGGEQSIQHLNNIAGRLRYALSQRLTTRITPRLQFIHDRAIEKGNRLLALIDSVRT